MIDNGHRFPAGVSRRHDAESVTRGRFVLRRLDRQDWLIQDSTFAADDARHVVACVRDDGSESMEVVWLHPVPLPTRYRCPQDVLDDLARWSQRRRGDGRPIAHFPPSDVSPQASAPRV